jgi:hypothetical protein
MVAAAFVITAGTVTIDYFSGGMFTLAPAKVSVALEPGEKPPGEPPR